MGSKNYRTPKAPSKPFLAVLRSLEERTMRSSFKTLLAAKQWCGRCRFDNSAENALIYQFRGYILDNGVIREEWEAVAYRDYSWSMGSKWK